MKINYITKKIIYDSESGHYVATEKIEVGDYVSIDKKSDRKCCIDCYRGMFSTCGNYDCKCHTSSDMPENKHENTYCERMTCNGCDCKCHQDN